MIECNTFTASIYISITKQEAISLLSEYFGKMGMCATVTEIDFVFTGGRESGVCIGFINYPKYVNSPEEITQKVIEMANKMLTQVHQRSCSVVCSDRTYYLTNPGIQGGIKSLTQEVEELTRDYMDYIDIIEEGISVPSEWVVENRARKDALLKKLKELEDK